MHTSSRAWATSATASSAHPEGAGSSNALQAATGSVQNAHRLASSGISLRHCAHFFVVGSAGGSLRERATMKLTGLTTKKKTAKATSMNATTALMNSPIRKVEL